MKNLLFILLFAISTFAGEINIPKGVGDVDGAVYTTDGKTLYTLKNETVTKWSVEPLKQLDTFETTVNHLRDYVSEEIDKNYLEGLTKDDKSKPLELSETGNYLTVSSQYISETWNLGTKHLSTGRPRGIKPIKIYFKKEWRRLYLRDVRSLKPLHSIKVSVDKVPCYEIYFNPTFSWRKNNQLRFLNMDLAPEILPKHEITTVITTTDNVSFIYHDILTDQTEKSKKGTDIITTRIMLEKAHTSDPYAEVWKTKNAHEAMEKLYGITQSQSFKPNYSAMGVDGGYLMHVTFGLDFTSFLISNSLEEGDAPYPLMILRSDVIDMKSDVEFGFVGHQRIRSHGFRSSINFSMTGKTKDQKVYEWNTVIPGLPGDF